MNTLILAQFNKKQWQGLTDLVIYAILVSCNKLLIPESSDNQVFLEGAVLDESMLTHVEGLSIVCAC
jgi:hypothetical protein